MRLDLRHIPRLSGMAMAVLTVVMSLLMFPAALSAQDGNIPELELKVKAYRGFTHIVDEYGDTCRLTYIRDVYVFPELKFKNKKEEKFYWRTVRDVRLTLPYAKLIAETLIETYEYIETFPTKKEREQYLKRMEKSLFEQYKPVLRKFSRRQARVLVKLIQRETNQSSYDIIRAFLGSFRAGFWQGFGKLFGVSLKADYNPAADRDDAILERIACGVEEGRL